MKVHNFIPILNQIKLFQNIINYVFNTILILYQFLVFHLGFQTKIVYYFDGLHPVVLQLTGNEL